MFRNFLATRILSSYFMFDGHGLWDHGLNPCRSTLCELNHDHAWSGDEMRVYVVTRSARAPGTRSDRTNHSLLSLDRSLLCLDRRCELPQSAFGVRLVCVGPWWLIEAYVYVLMFDYR